MSRILFLAPLRPPITGQHMASLALLDELRRSHEVDVVDYGRASLNSGVGFIRRIIEVFGHLWNMRKKVRRADVVYLTISQSVAGNLKDLFIFLICFSKLQQMVIHLHGGGLRASIFDRNALLGAVNRFFLRRVGRVIVLGDSLRGIFHGMARKESIRVVPNFAHDDLFVSPDDIRAKFSALAPMRVLFMSNLLAQKGYDDLLDAYLALEPDTRARVRVDFAGGFETQERGERFLDRVAGVEGVVYHGFVDGRAKRELFSMAHVFCLPTYYDYEGQPISIIEAYASGCVVLTTDHAGIADIFSPGTNGYQVEKKSPSSISSALLRVVSGPDEALRMALANHAMATLQFSRTRYCDNMSAILKEAAEQPR